MNPEKPIQPFVVKLTGINNKMLRNAPKFYEVAKRIIEITDGCTFIAHNTSFDYRIIKMEFDRLGYNYERSTLCTVALSQKLFPNQESYSLGKLCTSLGIPFSNRHRAEGDTLATVKLFEMLLFKDVDKEIVKSTIVAPKIPVKLATRLQNILDGLPQKEGVYYFHDAQGKILYIDRHSNIKKAVTMRFLQDSKKIKKLIALTSAITYDLLGNELMSQLKRYKEIALHKPSFNKRLKSISQTINFSHPNMIILNHGRHATEQSVILIENDKYIGNTFVDLHHQIRNIDILHNLITKEKDSNENRMLIKKYLQTRKVKKIIRF